MTISQERFNKVVTGLIELINQCNLEIQQQTIWLKERDERITQLDQQLKDTRFDATQARITREESDKKRFTVERELAESKKITTELEQMRAYNNTNAKRMLDTRDAQITALQATITQLKKRISKLKLAERHHI